MTESPEGGDRPATTRTIFEGSPENPPAGIPANPTSDLADETEGTGSESLATPCGPARAVDPDPPSVSSALASPPAPEASATSGSTVSVVQGSPKGHAVIRGYLDSLDGSPGVYRMLDRKGAVLYVGKARNLRKRVAAYAKSSGHSPRIERMVAATASMMFLTTGSETEALLLEQNLIKQLKPRYNVLLRDDKSFPGIVITSSHRFPRIAKHRGRKSPGDDHFGPFASAGAVNRTLNQLQKAFLLRNCSDSMFSARTRPCLQFQIARCTAPCVGRVSEAAYATQVGDAKRFLSGRTRSVQKSLAEDMRVASENLEFERAAALRDRIQALTATQLSQTVNPRSVRDADVIALHGEGGQACVQLFFIRAQQNWGNRAYFPRMGAGAPEAEALEAFVGQFYANKTPPARLILSHDVENPDLLEDALSRRRGQRVRLLVPQRGEKRELVATALRNAREALALRMSETAAQEKLLAGLADRLGLGGVPARIEVYDNSHIQGAHATGAMIVADSGGFRKSDYRKYTIGTDRLTPGDDYAMMREVLTRRFRRLATAGPAESGETGPDLVIIDGGAGHVRAAAESLVSTGFRSVPVLGVSKGPERDAGREVLHRSGYPPLVLGRNDPVLYLIQRLRDEAHRFAIGSHRRKRTRAIGATTLDEVPGVGAARRRALLAHFGSAKAVERAGLQDLKAVDGISDALARSIHDFFHDRQ